MLILECGRLDTLRATGTNNCLRPVAEKSFRLARINESDALDGYLCTAVDGDEPRCHIEDERIKESICVVVACVALSVGRKLHLQNVWLGVLRHFASNELGAAKLSFDVNVLVWVITKAALKVGAGIVKALEASATQLHDDTFGSFDMAVAW